MPLSTVDPCAILNSCTQCKQWFLTPFPSPQCLREKTTKRMTGKREGLTSERTIYTREGIHIIFQRVILGIQVLRAN